ncbi:hypothetical protein K435DRAFT_575709, partial [Dendrothele bispora CBS 962.96]
GAITKKALRDYLLMMDTSSDSDILLGLLPMFEGMNVILKSRNISTELGITNGAQGIIRKYLTRTDEMGNQVCTAALVEFPDSRVEIPGLPPKWYPIKPVRCTFKVRLPSTHIIVVTRWQLPLQPGYAVTGQSAQGK